MNKESNHGLYSISGHFRRTIKWFIPRQRGTLWCILLLCALAPHTYAEPGGAYDTPGSRALRSFFIPIVIWSAVIVLTMVSATVVGAKRTSGSDPLPAPLNAPSAPSPPSGKPAKRARRGWIIVGFAPAIAFSLTWLWLGVSFEYPAHMNYLDHMIRTGLQVSAMSALVILPPWSYLQFWSGHPPFHDNRRRSLQIGKGILTVAGFMCANVAIVLGAILLYGIIAVLYFVVEPVLEVLWAST